VSFDPFCDAKTRGYLRNIHGLPEGKQLKKLEHQDFALFLPDVLLHLEELRDPAYGDLLTVHRELFGGLYPWAGQDRFELFPGSVVSKGETVFAVSDDIQKAFDLGMSHRQTPGQTLGHLAYAHPFLEGNGRALFTFFDDHLRRKRLALDWATLGKTSFLQALDAQISNPNGNSMDVALKPHLSQVKRGAKPRASLLDVALRPRLK
jgi:cell filamentation protein